MDLIGQLSSALGVESNKAQALAGTLLGAARSQLAENGDAEDVAKLDAAVPELSDWKSTANAQVQDPSVGDGAGEGLGGLFSSLSKAAGSSMGQQLIGAVAGEGAREKAAVVSVLGQLGLQPSHAAMAAPVLLDFLEDRLSKDWTSRLVKAAPILMGLADEAPPTEEPSLANQALGALGKLF